MFAEKAGLAQRVEAALRTVKDFPAAGVLFYDISPVLRDKELFHDVIEYFALELAPLQPTHIVGIEARGFILGGAVALALGCGFIPIRKAGKLPPPTTQVTYDLEYGSETLEIAAGAIEPGARVVIIDDVLATGGTARAAADLMLGEGVALAGFGFLLELVAMNGREHIRKYPTICLIAC